CLQYDEFPYTF
nr:immunoglobulin light chain junction region [Mus musculus]NSL97090.1 immunoglobulin light chain junction region [Mus musculus]NSL97527.1 immunoglobulin light chain junction region [Mus musculus]NSL97779.1 immunoglobulin light chain junction region [Mus musculus]NSL98503.1 immunoglobulin light chain junction region [Mus musculus]